MFPAPSPNTQAIFNLQSGGATPGTLEFQRTAMQAAARSKADTSTTGNAATNANQTTTADYKPAQQTSQGRQDPFGAPESEAVNSLYMLAQTGGRQNNNQFAVPNQTVGQQQRMSAQAQDTSNQRGNDRNNGNQPASNGGDYEDSDEQKPTTRSKGKKNSKCFVLRKFVAIGC